MLIGSVTRSSNERAVSNFHHYLHSVRCSCAICHPSTISDKLLFSAIICVDMPRSATAPAASGCCSRAPASTTPACASAASMASALTSSSIFDEMKIFKILIFVPERATAVSISGVCPQTKVTTWRPSEENLHLPANSLKPWKFRYLTLIEYTGSCLHSVR